MLCLQEQQLQEQLAALQQQQSVGVSQSPEGAALASQVQQATQMLQQRDQDMADAMAALQVLQQQVQQLAAAADATGLMQEQQQQVQQQLVQLQVVLRRHSSTGAEALHTATSPADGPALLQQQLQEARDAAAAEVTAVQVDAAAKLSEAEAKIAELSDELQQLRAESAERALQVFYTLALD